MCSEICCDAYDGGVGMLSGGVAAAVSTPTDLALVRMMADGR